MKLLMMLWLLVCGLATFAQIPPGYYNNAAFLTGNPLKIALHNIIDDHTVIDYSNLWPHFQNTDKTSGNKVWDIYSAVAVGSPAYQYNFGSDQCGNYSNEGDCYNREHSFPKSWFNDVAPMDSDLFHIYPTDGFVNGMRSNLPYGEVSSATNTSTNGSKTGSNTYPGYNGTVFEPIDEFKGDLARTYFYMMTRYMDVCSSWTTDMMTGGDLSPWAESMLLAWHLSDTVSQKEIDRNNAVHDVQNNRNPFIDHPEWVEYIWGPIASTHDQTAELMAFYHQGRIQLEGVILNNCRISVYDMSGQMVQDEVLMTNIMNLNDNISNGLYIAIIQSDLYFKSFRFLK